MRDAAATLGPMSDRYTHGHHESVLRSHRWRTAQNSAAYLLDRLNYLVDSEYRGRFDANPYHS